VAWCAGALASAAASSSSGDVVGKASGLQKDIDSTSVRANHLTVSFYVLLAWVALVTVVLLTIVALSCQRWRRRRRRAAEWEADDGRRSVSDASSVCSRSPSDIAAASADCRDRTVLEGVEIGRRASTSQAGSNDALDGRVASTAEP